MRINRREFVKLCLQSGVALSALPEIFNALVLARESNPCVIWLQGASCSGCSVSLLNSVHPKVKEVLLEIISLKFHQNLMAGTGDGAVNLLNKIPEEFNGKFLLVVEGSIPTAENGLYCSIGEIEGKPETMAGWMKKTAPRAKAVIAAGTCAAYGGIPAGNPNPTGAIGVSSFFKENGIKTPLINIPGCPSHPDWFIGTLTHVLLYGVPSLDRNLRPKMFFSNEIHENCPRHSYYAEDEFAKKFGDKGCLYELGCKGMVTKADCYKRLWNNKSNWCIGSGGICAGCVEPDFLDGVSPIYEKIG
ncbi:MAG: hydrogenase small subunit [bacterium]